MQFNSHAEYYWCFSVSRRELRAKCMAGGFRPKKMKKKKTKTKKKKKQKRKQEKKKEEEIA